MYGFLYIYTSTVVTFQFPTFLMCMTDDGFFLSAGITSSFHISKKSSDIRLQRYLPPFLINAILIGSSPAALLLVF
jgi:hypothetical protein